MPYISFIRNNLRFGIASPICTLYISSNLLLNNDRGSDCYTSNPHIQLINSISTSLKLKEKEEEDTTSPNYMLYDTKLKHIFFGIPASSPL